MRRIDDLFGIAALRIGSANAAHPERRRVAVDAKRRYRRPLRADDAPGALREVVRTEDLVHHVCAP